MSKNGYNNGQIKQKGGLFMRREGEISILGIAVRILLVFLFVFLLIWLFPMPNLNPVYSGIFNDNVQTMKDAAKSYFTMDRMPLEEGDSVKLTLRQMIDKKLLLPFVDSNDNECDADTSFVEVTKAEDEYLMKIYLSCTDNTDYIIEHIGCYEICKDCETTTTTEIPTTTVKNVINRKTTTKKKTTTTTKKKTVIEYQFKKTSTSEVIDHYECDGKDYNLEGDSCIKYEQEDTKPATISNYKCNKSGYTYNSTLKKCVKTEEATQKYTCSKGTLSGNKCIVTGYTTEYTGNPTCPSGYTINSAKTSCSKVTGKEQFQKVTNMSTSYGKPSDAIYIVSRTYLGGSCSSNCWKVVYVAERNVVSYKEVVCKDGSKPNASNKCPVKKSYTDEIPATPSGFTCKTSGYSYDETLKKCIVTDSATPVYECTDSSYKLTGKVCHREKSILEIQKATVIYKSVTVTEYKWSTSKTLEGWTATGKTRTVTVKA